MNNADSERIEFIPRKEKIKKMTNENIIEYFIALSKKRTEADSYMDIYTYNKIYKILQVIEKELKSRPGDQRSILIPLIFHPNLQVRLNASLATLAVTPDALMMLRAIAALDVAWEPEQIEALHSVEAIDEGRYIPT
ncbi:DUF2019 domain-containing protein [Azorhizobium sp. AG788]|uniref:DUF2019 domain-containing protein n=1 Tax=Azorhizobium sp. AG788 TaxID=2183897 RepID=UPI0031398E43